MRFNYNNTEYRIGFSQITETNEIPGIGLKEQRSTIARIRTGERDSTEELVAEAKVTQYYKDSFSFEKARKYALGAALISSEFAYNKEFRKAAWAAYHTRPGGIWFGKDITANTTA